MPKVPDLGPGNNPVTNSVDRMLHDQGQTTT